MFDIFKKFFKENPSDFGKNAEKTAQKHLRSKGYTIIETNYRCKKGEIDIVAKCGNYLVFCEVKARRNKNYGTALEGVTESKIKKIRETAEDYLTKRNLRGADCRFDVVTLDETGNGLKVELIPNAF
jgi:putative endonuclease